jgi:hypothetical protein
MEDFCAHNLVAKLVSFIIFLLNLEILKFLNCRKLPVIFVKKTGNGGQKNGRYTGAPVSVFTGASTLALRRISTAILTAILTADN